MERFWIARLPSKLLNAPLASLAALARSLRSPHRGEFSLLFQQFFNICLILEIVSICTDLSWIYMPTWPHVGLNFRLLGHLGASWARLGASWPRLGQVLGRLEGVLGRCGPSWGRLGSILGASWVVLGRLGSVLGASWSVLEASWAPFEPSWEPLELEFNINLEK